MCEREGACVCVYVCLRRLLVCDAVFLSLSSCQRCQGCSVEYRKTKSPLLPLSKRLLTDCLASSEEFHSQSLYLSLYYYTYGRTYIIHHG